MQPHGGGPIVHAGAPLEVARGAMILVHGRTATPKNILELLPRIDRPELAALAPAAAGGTWYPRSFLATREENEPGITSALTVLETIVSDLISRSMPAHKIILLGFSQGACLSSEFALRHPRQYGGLMALSGGLIGSPGTTWDDAPGSFDGVPVFLGCSDVDAHIPATRVIETEHVFRRLGANVTRRLYAGMGHVINDDEIAFVQGIVDEVMAAAP